jgi:hypothetical protein
MWRIINCMTQLRQILHTASLDAPQQRVSSEWISIGILLVPKMSGAFANGLRTNVALALQDVDLLGSMLGDTGIKVLVGGLRQNSTLATLALCDNGITATGVQEMVNLLIGSTGGITDLVLNCNPIGYEGVNILANALRQNVIGQLRRLYLDACTLGDDSLV